VLESTNHQWRANPDFSCRYLAEQPAAVHLSLVCPKVPKSLESIRNPIATGGAAAAGIAARIALGIAFPHRAVISRKFKGKQR